MNTPEDIDRLFHQETERLADVSPKTSFQKERFWNQLEARLEPKKTNRSYVLSYGIAASLVLLGIVIALGWKMQQQDKELKHYAEELNKWKSEKSLTTSTHRVDTVYIQPVLVEKKTFHSASKPSTSHVKQVPRVMEEKIAETTTDTMTEIATHSEVGVRKPFRIVSKNHLPHPMNEIPDSEGIYVNADRQHTPKITILLTPKSNQ